MLNPGDEFNLMTVCGFAFKRRGKFYWNCKCKCGSETVVSSSNLRSGHTKSCGCLRVAKAKLLRTHGMKQTRIYGVWSNMLDRCSNTKNRKYQNYGGRGIKVCDRWRNSFVDFFSDVGHPPDGCQLDRIDNSLGYSPENCRWITPKQNCRNKSNNRVLTYNGRSLCLAEWEDVTGISQKLMLDRIGRGWSTQRILETQVIKKYRNSTHKQKNENRPE